MSQRFATEPFNALISDTLLSSLQLRNDSRPAAVTQLIASQCWRKKFPGSFEPAAAEDVSTAAADDLAKQEVRTFPIFELKQTVIQYVAQSMAALQRTRPRTFVMQGSGV
jgi:hypothetical protein